MQNTPRDLSHGVQEFLAEAEEIMEDLSRDLAVLSVAARSGSGNPDLVNAIFRGAHSLKGLAGMLGYTDISGLAHRLETLLDLLRLGKAPLDDTTVNVLFAAVDALGGLLSTCSRGGAAPDISVVHEQLDACCARSMSPPSCSLPRPDLPERITHSLTEFEEHLLDETVRLGRLVFLVHASFSLDSFDRELESLISLLREQGHVISTLPSPGRERSDAIDFDILVGSGVRPDGLPSGVSCQEVPVTAAAPPPCDAQNGVAVSSGAPVTVSGQPASARSISGTVRVDIGTLDELMAVVGELVALQFSLADSIAQLRTAVPAGSFGLEKTTARLGKILNELQKGVMEIRLVPVRTLYDKVARIIRKIATDEGRNLDLILQGAETKLDKQIIEDISDPLMHLIRNAVDHGIEAPSERLAAGKEVVGRISISATQKGNRVVIEVSDDGRGIDLSRVRRRAAERGLVHHPDDLTDREALDLIFEPGFSTSEVVSELSGRGVGMDVVKSNITALSGTVTVETEPGRGSRVVITLPITLAIIRTLLIDAGDETYGVPVSAIQETVPFTQREILTIEGSELLPVREMLLPVVRLDRFFGGRTLVPRENDGYAIVTEIAARRVGIMVDAIRGQQDLILKSLGEFLGEVRGIAGVADLGEDRTILVLDVAGIIEETYRGGSGLVP